MESLKFGSLNYSSKKSISRINPDFIVIVGKKKYKDCLAPENFSKA